MSSVASPRTPSPEPLVHGGEKCALQSAEPARDTFGAHRPSSATDAMTPPPSTQPPKSNSRPIQPRTMGPVNNSLVSPPATVRIGPPITSIGLYGEVPTLESVQQMDEDQLRDLVAELLPALGEARVTAAHSKLQHSLLAIEKEEAAKRAEVEHEATRREVQVLQDSSPIHRYGFSPQSPHASMQRSLQLALAHCQELQRENTILEKRLRASKRLIARLDGENADLKDRVYLLRQRIKANREHLNDMQSSGAISLNGTPVIDYGTPQPRTTPRTPATGRPIRDLDTLLIAGQMLSGETASVPSTPTPARPKHSSTQHVRGAHSLSSLPSTPNRSRPVTADNHFSSPSEQTTRNNHVSFTAPSTHMILEEDVRDRNDRDSTISVSDDENDPYRDDEITGSQASQRATTMLRRSLGSNAASPATPAPNSGKLLQGRLMGQVKKPGFAKEDASPKRGGDQMIQDDIPRSNKKAKLTASVDRVGLGIKDWSHVER